jgi:hypothetical protein
MNITTLAEQINEAASTYHVGDLQRFRAKLHGKKAGTFKIFSALTTFGTDWGGYAFHHGGRTELQFNVGVYDAERKCRHGLAFSFERTQTLPDPLKQLGPKVTRFNYWVRTSGKASSSPGRRGSATPITFEVELRPTHSAAFSCLTRP